MASSALLRNLEADHGGHYAEGQEIVLKLSAGERILAMHRDVRVPLSAVKSVDVIDEPIRRIQGLKPRNSSLDHPDVAKTALTA